MAAVARRIPHDSSGAARLRLVPPARSSSAKRPRSACDPARSARRNFRAFAMLALLVAVLGMGRVWLSVMAAEASLDANALRQEIKNLRYEGDMLEVRQSALGSPSRILAIAGATMDMAKAEDVTYIDLPAETFASAKTQDRPVSDAGRDWLGVALDLAAGEAQILLVGDVGLASAR